MKGCTQSHMTYQSLYLSIFLSHFFFVHLISSASMSATVFKYCIHNEDNQVYYCKQNQGAEIYYTPRKLCLWEGILFSRCPSKRTNERTNESVSVTFGFLNILKSHRWNFMKLCKNIHMYQANTTYKKLRVRGRYYKSYFPL